MMKSDGAAHSQSANCNQRAPNKRATFEKETVCVMLGGEGIHGFRGIKDVWLCVVPSGGRACTLMSKGESRGHADVE